MKNSVSILNIFRNKYYTDGNNTENGIVANAIDDILPEYVKLKRERTRELKHGEWIPTANGKFECSVCHSVWNRRFLHDPHCGARMDGGAEK